MSGYTDLGNSVVRLRLASMDHIWELHRVLDEKYLVEEE
jgi:hypothetical protein